MIIVVHIRFGHALINILLLTQFKTSTKSRRFQTDRQMCNMLKTRSVKYHGTNVEQSWIHFMDWWIYKLGGWETIVTPSIVFTTIIMYTCYTLYCMLLNTKCKILPVTPYTVCYWTQSDAVNTCINQSNVKC